MEIKKAIKGDKEITLYELKREFSTVYKVCFETIRGNRIDYFFKTETQANVFYDLLIISDIQILT